jgi:proline iminopeptidase
MKSNVLALLVAWTTGSSLPTLAAPSNGAPPHGVARESRIPVAGASLYTREIGQGRALIVLHGGPDFDSAYLLPDLDRLASAYRLIYYDQRGRGRSADGVQPDAVTLTSDLEDLDAVRQHFQLEHSVLLGHSWGTVLALEYALRHPERVSQMTLMNPAPASATDLAMFREVYAQKLGPDLARQREIMAGAPYKEGEPSAVVARYRLHFKPALMRPTDYERLMQIMGAAFASQGKEGIVKARAVEDRLMRDTWEADGYDLLPKLRVLRIPTLVLTGDHDFFPVSVASHIADAIPRAQLVVLTDCGHFAYLECPGDTRKGIDAFLGNQLRNGRPLNWH